ncbi:cytidylyltransferase [Mollisia scopiformis]|uniref:Cytidylyltransferase n=1 Tax=Mollisia scopiformis TaxID=149040 RepID=A0A194X553_MOLSC|nr:cytidylyltransferase [Mollisia scopiformis]KUJ15308.1 cytidylyltransferase [Mollisia scopiformis]
MSPSSNSIPATPRVISPSPTPSESRDSADGYFGPMTRSARKKQAAASQVPINEEIDEDDEVNAELRRARSKSRSPMRVRRMSGLTAVTKAPTKTDSILPSKPVQNGKATNGHLSPDSASGSGWSWRDISRSPSPLGLIPIHRHFRVFVHKHEVPRKLLHVSIGFFTTWLYVSGAQTTTIAPYLMSALAPITAVDFARHRYASFNRLYVRVLGALMRETEYAGWNGVIWYLLGVWIVLSFFPKDVAIMGVLLLSWCDTAASTFGRAYGRYTPRIRKGKSLAGSLGAFVVGVLTAVFFWGWLAPRTSPYADDINFPFMFTGTLSLPAPLRDLIGITKAQGSISGGLALGIMSLWTGFAASASELVDLFGWDDNLTIPVLSGMGMWGFLKIFG